MPTIVKYILVFFVSMVPIIELRGAVPIGVTYFGLNEYITLAVCIVGNMVPVPFVYFFARKLLQWGYDKPVIGPICRFLLNKGENAGRILTEKASRRGTFLALLLFVGIPLPGTGAWTGTLAASILDMGIKHTVGAVVLGVLLAGVIMMTAGVLGFSLL